MKRYSLLFLIPLFFCSHLFAQNTNEYYRQYIDEYHRIAQKQQEKHNIPASITLAQGLIESGAGRSQLALKSKNHFGIKCHDWNGSKVYHDDDQAQECFRKYSDVKDSYEDHSLFLVGRPRYKELFNLRTTDYVGWAHGLKKAGYATDPNYAYKLIDIIERYELYKFDDGGIKLAVETVVQKEIYKANGVKFVVAEVDDSVESVALKYGISPEKLRNYNDLAPNARITKGQVIYLKKKKRRVLYGNSVHVVQANDTYFSISQLHGIRLLSLYNLNDLKTDSRAFVGQILKLR